MTDEIKYNLSPNPVLYFSDEKGQPLANGKLWFFKASAHSTEKAVYKERLGSPPSAWLQPIILDAGGHAVDPTSGAIQPVYFASDENYYLHFVKFDDSAYYNEDKFNAPANLILQQQSTVAANIRNYILNSQFRFFEKEEFKSSDDDLPQDTDIPIAKEGWTFRRNNEQGEIVISFKPFAPGQSDVDNTPTNYLDFNKTGFGSGGETENDITYALGNTQDFSGQTLTLGLTGLSNTSANISVYVRQFFGTGGSPSGTVETAIGVISLDGTWTEKTLQIPIPTISGKPIGTNNDDVLSLIFRAPLNAVAQFSITNFQLNIGIQLQIYDKKTEYDDGNEAKAYELPIVTLEDQFSVLKVGASGYYLDAETGKVESYMLGDIPAGYIPLDGSTYVRTDKVGSTNIKYDRLYQKWQNDVHLSNGNAFGYGADGFFPMIYPVAGANLLITNEKRDTAISAWDAATSGFTVTSVRTGADKGFTTDFVSEGFFDSSISESSHDYPKQYLSIENVSVGAVTAAGIGDMPAAYFNITTVQTGTGALKNVVYIGTSPFWSFIKGGNYFLISSTSTDYYIWFTKKSIGDEPVDPPAPVTGRTGIKINLSDRDSVAAILNKIKNVLNNLSSEFLCERVLGLEAVAKTAGVVTVAAAGTSNAIIDLNLPGTVTTQSVSDIWLTKAEFIVAGTYFLLSSTLDDYYVWFKKDGVGTDPAVVSRTGIQVDLNSDDNATMVVLRIKQALEGTATHSITNITPASSLSGGEYMLIYNFAVDFYVWYTVDDTGSDPALSGKTGIKVELIGTDTAIQVANKTSKAISSYYFVVRDLRGYFLRSRDDGNNVDISSDMRLPRGDGEYGDVIGSTQVDANKYHHHSLAGTTNIGTPEPLSAANTITGSGEVAVLYYEIFGGDATYRNLVSDNGFESRPRNVNVLYCIKI